MFGLLCFFVLLATHFKVESLECSSDKRCRCQTYRGKLWANCENLNLTTAPFFNDDVTGINLARNSIANFPESHPRGILYLDVSENILQKIDMTSLSKYKDLRNLTVSNNKLRTIELGTFENSSKLLHLDISNNRELTIEVLVNVSRDLRNSSSIRVLNFEKLQCTYGVSFNLMKYHTAFLRHTKLEELNLASNRINSLETGVLTELPKSLKRLNLANNILSFGFYLAEFGDLPNIISLNVSFQASFRQLLTKEFLIKCNDTRAVGTRFTEHPDIWRRNPKLSSSLKGNVNISIYLPRNLKTLYFHDNLYKFTLQDYVFKSVHKQMLTHLYMQNNIIYELNGPIVGFESVEHIDFSNNFCGHISSNFFQYFRNLSYLNLSHNALGETLERDKNGDIFQYLRMLTSLDLKRNRVVSLPNKIFRNLNKLENLDVSYNSLNEFSIPINHMTNLLNLDLSNNQLSSLDEETRKALDSISQDKEISVNLKGNRLRCDCENLDFIKWMHTSRKVKFLHFHSYSCIFSNSSKIHFSDIENLLQTLEKQCFSYILLIVVMTSLIIVALTTALSRILYRYRWKLRYMYYVAREKYKDNKLYSHKTHGKQYHFDAFMSYADSDRQFVISLVKFLEDKSSLRLCIHHRDFIPGTGIEDNITNAIHNSRQTVCIMTSHFLESYWCMFELNMARMESIYSRNGENVLFLVALEENAMKKLPFSLMDLIESKSYVEFPEGGDEEEVSAFRSNLKRHLNRVTMSSDT
ncbi:toll-like receptor 4 [Saccostrea echinata]|uniref:toll-like receptor 4 n=1 Tax=Saccostrea echinata TaxID=191078 RepID=UPI002A834D05|nr:toll-like receptor 4 [Saccostrea echinata]